MNQTPLAEALSTISFILTGALLAYASHRAAGRLRRSAAALSLLTVTSAVYFMMVSYSGNDSWWIFERPGPFVRKAIKDRGYFQFVDEENAASSGAAAANSNGPAAGPADRSNEENGALAKAAAAANKLAAVLNHSRQTLFAGDVVTDCSDCPEMVVVQPGFFRIGAAPGDAGAQDVERPSATVIVRKHFAIGRTEITIGQYAAFLSETGHKHPTCGSDVPQTNARLPLACVSWRDAVAYTQWLSAKTGRKFRLPTEAEWQYAASGGVSTPFASGTSIPAGTAGIQQTEPLRPVGSYPANGFGLRDVHGSVAEMVADCWSPTLQRLPRASDDWNRRGDCRLRVLKDAHAGEPTAMSRLSARRPLPLEQASPGVGFRVMREM